MFCVLPSLDHGELELFGMFSAQLEAVETPLMLALESGAVAQMTSYQERPNNILYLLQHYVKVINWPAC